MARKTKEEIKELEACMEKALEQKLTITTGNSLEDDYLSSLIEQRKETARFYFIHTSKKGYRGSYLYLDRFVTISNMINLRINTFV